MLDSVDVGAAGVDAQAPANARGKASESVRMHIDVADDIATRNASQRDLSLAAHDHIRAFVLAGDHVCFEAELHVVSGAEGEVAAQQASPL